MEAKKAMQTKPRVPSIYKFLSQLSSSLLMFLLSLTQNPQALQSFDQPSIEDYLYCQAPKEKKLWSLSCSDKCHCLIKTPTLVMMTNNHVKSKHLSSIVFWYYIVCLHVGSQMAVLTCIGLHEYTMCLWA